jgi:peptide deformylase
MAKILKIVTHPDSILRKKSKEIDLERLKNKDFQKLCDDMILTMKEKDGVGLAAPQIGKNIRMIVVSTKDGPICAINPTITKKSLLKEWDEEGCLSVPDTFGKVRRHKNVTCCFIDREGNSHSIDAKGFMARIFQHEIDHLNGTLFIDKAKNIKEINNY